MDGERATGTATVLFSDLAGSTELMARLGDERFDAVRTDHFAGLGAVVGRFDGSVIKNTGDGILATFPSAVAALKAAVGLQQTTRSQSDQHQLDLGLRVGLAVGEVSFEDGDVFGTPVVEAARLVALADTGQILCTALVRAIAGSRAGHTFVDVGPIELRGLPDPVLVCEVEWAPAERAPAIDLPPVLTGAGRIFVGRAEPLEQLRQRWKEAESGERRLVLIGGEPGVGKTRLATALAHHLHGAGAVVLAGRCDEDLGVPYQPIVEALRHYVVRASAPRLGTHAGELARLVPELPQLVQGLPEPLSSDPETERYRLFDAVAAWLSDVSGDTPVLLVVDDLHWAAKPTLLLLRHVLRSPEPLRLLVVATYRDTDVGRRHPLADLLADLPRLPGADRLSLSGLDVPGVASFIEQAAGHELDDQGTELARTIWQETEGNAFFVTEILRHLAESGAIEQHDGRWVLTRALDELGVPEGVRDVIGRRLSRLPDDTNRVLACASVVGVEFEPAVVVAAGGLPEDTVLSALDEAIAARLVVESPGPVPRNRFSHALVRSTLYDELSAARRVALHRKVAEAIESIHGEHLDDHLPALAHHWARASAPTAETSRAVEYARRAGERALAQFANDEAATYFSEALELLDVAGVAGDDPRRLALLISLGEAQRRRGDPRHRETLLAASALAARLGESDALAQAALANTRGFMPSLAGAVDPERVAALEAALATRTEDGVLRARLLSTLAMELTFEPDSDRSLTLSDEATDMARRLGDVDTLAEVLLARFSTTLRPDTLHLRLPEADELLGLVPSLRDPARRAGALFWGYRTRVVAGQMVGTADVLETASNLADRIGQPALRWMARLLQCGRAIIQGALVEANRFAAEALAVGGGQPEAAWAFPMQLFLIQTEQGRVEDNMAATFECLSEEIRAVGSLFPAADVAGALAALEIGRVDTAKDVLVRTGDRAARPDYYSILLDSMLAQLAVRLNEPVYCDLLYERLRPFTHWLVPHSAFPAPSVSFHLGLLAGRLGREDDAEAHFAQAVADHEHVGAPTFLARTRLEWAKALLNRGRAVDVPRARSLLQSAAGTARQLELPGVEQEAAARLSQA